MIAADAQAVMDEILAAWPTATSKNPPAGPEFEAYCGVVARLRDAQQRLASEGPIIADAKGNPIQHPALAIEKSCAEQLRRWGATFRPHR